MAKNTFNDGSENPRVVDIPREIKERLATAADVDAEMSRKARGYEKKFEALEMAVPKERELLERMEKDCLTLKESKKVEKMRAAQEAEKVIRADVQSGKIGVVQFHEQMTAHSRKTKAEAESIDHEIIEAIEAVRAKALEILKMEVELWEAKANYFYCLNHPTDTALTEIEKMVKEMSFRSQALQGHYMSATAEQDKFKLRLDRAKGQALVAGWSQDNLTLREIQALVFLPEIPKTYLDSLTMLVLEIEANEARRTDTQQDPGLYYISCSYMAGLTQPWTWLCRNENSAQVIRMSKQSSASGLTMAGIPTIGKLEG